MTNAVLEKALFHLADLHDGNNAAAGLMRMIEACPGSRKRRFYYEALLEREPENATVANMDVSDIPGTVNEFLRSDEFAARHIKTIRNLFPDRSAFIFLHIPKTGGNTVNHAINISQDFVVMRTPDYLTEGWGVDRLSYYGELVSSLRSSSKRIAISGHPRARDLVERNLKSYPDRVFTVIRDPVELMISWINYQLTIVHEEHQRGAGFSRRPDVSYIHSIIGHDWIAKPSAIPDETLESLITKTMHGNPICSTLGLEPSFKSAVEACEVLDVEIVPLSGLGEFLEKNGLPPAGYTNVSTKFVSKETISKRIAQLIYEQIGEDLKFYLYQAR